jgi:hypothetical protein
MSFIYGKCSFPFGFGADCDVNLEGADYYLGLNGFFLLIGLFLFGL